MYRPQETIDVYVRRIRVLARTLNYGEDLVRDQLIAGLPKEIASQLNLMNPPTVQECAQLAQRVLDHSDYASTTVSFALDNDFSEESWSFCLCFWSREEIPQRTS